MFRRRHPDCNKKTPYGPLEAKDLAHQLRTEGHDVVAAPCGCGGWHIHGDGPNDGKLHHPKAESAP